MRLPKKSPAVAILYGFAQALATITGPAADGRCYPIGTLSYSQVIDNLDRMDHDLCRSHCSTHVGMTHFALHQSGLAAFSCSCGRAADISVSPLADSVCDLICPNTVQETYNCGGINGEIVFSIRGSSSSDTSPDELKLVELDSSTFPQRLRSSSSVLIANTPFSGVHLGFPARSPQLSPTETEREQGQALGLTPVSSNAATLSYKHARRQASATGSGACATPTDYILAFVGGRATAQQAYVGRIGDPYPTDCSLAAVFKPTASGGLQIDGLDYGVNPGLQYAPLRTPQDGSIRSTFSITLLGGFAWTNSFFFSGQAGFCQDNTNQVYATFSNTAVTGNTPAGCTTVTFRVIARNTCQGSAIVSCNTISTSTTSTLSSSSPSTSLSSSLSLSSSPLSSSFITTSSTSLATSPGSSSTSPAAFPSTTSSSPAIIGTSSTLSFSSSSTSNNSVTVSTTTAITQSINISSTGVVSSSSGDSASSSTLNSVLLSTSTATTTTTSSSIPISSGLSFTTESTSTYGFTTTTINAPSPSTTILGSSSSSLFSQTSNATPNLSPTSRVSTTSSGNPSVSTSTTLPATSSLQVISGLSTSITNGGSFLGLTSTTQSVISTNSPPLTGVTSTTRAIVNSEGTSSATNLNTGPDTETADTNSGTLTGDRVTVTSPSASQTAGPAESTLSTVQTSPTPMPSPPPLVGTFEYLGCFGGRGGPLPSFTLVRQGDDNDVDVCVAACSGSRVAGAFETECYCGDFVDSSVSILLPENECNSPCPGNLTQSCGGLGAPLVRRQAPSSRLTVYIRIDSGDANTTTSSMVNNGRSSTVVTTSSPTSSITIVDISSTTLGEVTSTTQEPTNGGGTLILPPNFYTIPGDVPAGAICSTVTKSWLVGATTFLPTVFNSTSNCIRCSYDAGLDGN